MIDPILIAEANNWDDDTPVAFLQGVLDQCPPDRLEDVLAIGEDTMVEATTAVDLYTQTFKQCDMRAMAELIPFAYAYVLIETISED